MKAIDLTGEKFGRLAILGFAGNRRRPSGRQVRQWRCQCECGTQLIVDAANLQNGNTKSCGCSRANNQNNLQHGCRRQTLKTREYRSWVSMKTRCLNPKSDRFVEYGARGVDIDSRWMDFATFLADMGPAQPGQSIDRIDNSKGYCKENCRWASKLEQTQNRRITKRITHKGQTLTWGEWASRAGLTYEVFAGRMKRNWPLERILS